MSMAALLRAVSDCRPAMLTAPANGGTATRRTTTSTVLVTALKVPAERRMTVVLASVVGEVSIGGRVLLLSPVSGVSAAPLALRIVTLNVPPLAPPPRAVVVGPAVATAR